MRLMPLQRRERDFLGTGAVAAPRRCLDCRASCLRPWPELDFPVARRFFAECGFVFSPFGVEGLWGWRGGRKELCPHRESLASRRLVEAESENPPSCSPGAVTLLHGHVRWGPSSDAGEVTGPAVAAHGAEGVGRRRQRFSVCVFQPTVLFACARLIRA